MYERPRNKRNTSMDPEQLGSSCLLLRRWNCHRTFPIRGSCRRCIINLDVLHTKRGLQFTIALLCGAVFGFLLQKGGVTDYDVIIGQLLLKDFTVVKVMLSAVITGSLGIYALRSAGLVKLHPKPGSLGSSAIGADGWFDILPRRQDVDG